MEYVKDLVVLVPDKNMQFLFDGLLSDAGALGVREPSRQLDTHPLRDAGCLHADELLESQAGRFAHAIVITNSEQSGRSTLEPHALEIQIEGKLGRAGWGDRARAVVVDPGIGRWLLEHVLEETWLPGTSIQRTVEDALRRKRIPQSPHLYHTLGTKLLVEREQDRALQKIFSTLRQWFGVTNVQAGDTTSVEDEAQAFSEKLAVLSHDKSFDAALDLVFDHIDALLLTGRFSEVNQLLEVVKGKDLDPSILVGVLTITAAAREMLGARSALVVWVRSRLGEQLDADEVARTMQGLE